MKNHSSLLYCTVYLLYVFRNIKTVRVGTVERIPSSPSILGKILQYIAEYCIIKTDINILHCGNFNPVYDQSYIFLQQVWVLGGGADLL